MMNNEEKLRAALAAASLRDQPTCERLLKEVQQSVTEADLNNPALGVLFLKATTCKLIAGLEQSTEQHAKFLLSNQEPLKALAFLKTCRPSGTEDSITLNALQQQVESGLAHVGSFAAFKQMYCTPAAPSVSSADPSRSQALLNYLSKETNTPKTILSVGANDCLIESRVLDKLPEAVLTVAELAPHPEIQEALSQRFLSRIRFHQQTDLYCWTESQYDLIIMFEVLEHLPDVDLALGNLSSRLKQGGVGALSVPWAPRWFESVKIHERPYQHLRSFTEKSFLEALLRSFKHAKVVLQPDGTLLGFVKNEVQA